MGLPVAISEVVFMVGCCCHSFNNWRSLRDRGRKDVQPCLRIRVAFWATAPLWVDVVDTDYSSTVCSAMLQRLIHASNSPKAQTPIDQLQSLSHIPEPWDERLYSFMSILQTFNWRSINCGCCTKSPYFACSLGVQVR